MSQYFAELPTGSVTAAGVLVVSLIVGAVVDQLLYRFINSRTAAQGWAPGHQLAKGLHGLPTAIGLLIGLHLALQQIILRPSVASTVATVMRVVSILVTTAFVARVVGGIVRVYTEREGSRLPSTSIFVNIALAVVWVLGGISLLGVLGVSIAPLLTALGVGGLAVGLALQPTLENIFSGIQVLASRQIEPGDLIRLETGEEGAVLDVTWRNTTVMTPSNDVIIVPNSVLGRSRITNFSTLSGEHVLVVPVMAASTADPSLVEQCAREVALEVAAEVDGVVPEAEPTVRFAALTAAGLQVNVGLRVHSYPARIPVRHELLKRLQQRFATAGVELAGTPAPAAVSPAKP